MKILRKVLFAQAQVVSLKRGDGSGATVAAHGVSGGGARREILGEISPSTRQTIGMHLLSDVATNGRRNVLADDS